MIPGVLVVTSETQTNLVYLKGKRRDNTPTP
jgi:hypothetical protein